MAEREELRKRLMLQKTKNLISVIEGIKVLEYEEQTLFDEEYLRRINYLGQDKIPDSKISDRSNDAEVTVWINKFIDLRKDQLWYIWLNGYLVKIQILDTEKAITGLWNNIDPDCKGFVLIDEDKKMMYEFGNDSRNEENYLFDKYPLV